MYKALKSFCGKLTMNKGQVREIADKEFAKNLLEAGYIEEVKSTKTEVKTTKKKEK